MSQVKQLQIAKAYKKYGSSHVMASIARVAHGSNYCGQTSSATFDEIINIVNKWSLPKNATLLDAGCGNGCFLFPLYELLKVRVDGIDLCKELIEEAKEKTTNHLCHFIQGDYSNLPNEIQQLDGIICIGSMYWDLNLNSTFQCWNSRLKKGGKCLIFINTSTSPLTDEEREKTGETSFFSEKELTESINRYFKITLLSVENITYINWLQKWLLGMKKYWKTLIKEFGKGKSESMLIRFEAYLDFAKCGKTKRLIIEAEKKEEWSK